MSFTLLLFLILTLIVPYISFLLVSKEVPHPVKKKVQVIAHRGASGYAPENTMTAFRKAIDLQADMLELDVHMTKDDSVVIMHDYSVKRTTNGTGDIQDLTLSEIQALDAGSWFGDEFKNERVPTLEELLTMVDGKKTVLIELKWPDKGLYTTLVSRVVETVRRKKAESWVILQSFEKEYLTEAYALAPEIPQQQLLFGKSGLLPFYYDRNPRVGTFTPLTQASSVNVFYLYANSGFIESMHTLNKTVYAFTPNKETEMQRLINLGVDGLITNYPDKAREILSGE